MRNGSGGVIGPGGIGVANYLFRVKMYALPFGVAGGLVFAAIKRYGAGAPFSWWLLVSGLLVGLGAVPFYWRARKRLIFSELLREPTKKFERPSFQDIGGVIDVSSVKPFGVPGVVLARGSSEHESGELLSRGEVAVSVLVRTHHGRTLWKDCVFGPFAVVSDSGAVFEILEGPVVFEPPREHSLAPQSWVRRYFEKRGLTGISSVKLAGVLVGRYPLREGQRVFIHLDQSETTTVEANDASLGRRTAEVVVRTIGTSVTTLTLSE